MLHQIRDSRSKSAKKTHYETAESADKQSRTQVTVTDEIEAVKKFFNLQTSDDEEGADVLKRRPETGTISLKDYIREKGA
jgi:ATP:corrinoid adenosyltransferase